jgi:hypothetical protein
VRHHIVQRIVEAYAAHDAAQEAVARAAGTGTSAATDGAHPATRDEG